MASSASDDLKLRIMADGENEGDWGDNTNTNLRAIEESICQTNDIAFSGTATKTLSITDFSDPPQSGRGFRLNLTGTGTAGQILQVPDIQKSYIVNNGLSVDTSIQNSTGDSVTVPAGKTTFLYSTSAGVVSSINTFTSANVVGTFEISSNASVGGTLNIGGVTTSGNISADGTLNVSGNGSVGGTLVVTGDTDVTNFSANGTLDVSGNASVGGTLAVTGDADVTNLSANGTFDVSGNASVGGTLAVTGDTDVTNISANGTLDVSGNGSVGGTFNVEGDLKNTSGNLTVDPATQIFEIKGDGSSVEGQIQLNCHVNSHGQIIKAQPHSEGVTNTMLLPKGSNSTLVSEIATQTLTNKTLGSTSVDGTFNISGNASVGGTLKVTGDSDVADFSADGTLDVSGNGSVGGTFTLTGTGFLEGGIAEGVKIITSTGGSTVNLNVNEGGILYYTGTANTNFTFNIRGDASTTLNSIMDTGDSLGVALIMPQDSTARQQTALQIDGSGVTGLYWQGGATAEATGNGIEVFAVNIIKTGDADYTVFESITNFLKN